MHANRIRSCTLNLVGRTKSFYSGSLRNVSPPLINHCRQRRHGIAFSRRSARMPRSEERGGMAARSEAERNSLLVYKSPARKGGVLYLHLAQMAMRQRRNFRFKPTRSLTLARPLISCRRGSGGNGKSVSRQTFFLGISLRRSQRDLNRGAIRSWRAV